MDEKMEHLFAIRRVSDPTNADYLTALIIYNSVTPHDIKTDPNEISKWLGSNKVSNSFELMIFILYLGSEIIGMAMLCYLPNGKIVVYDYIAVKEQYRLNAVFFAYISLIQNYISNKGYAVAFYVVEISNKNAGKSLDKESRIFKKLICLEGFGRVKAKYQTLPLGLNHHESSFDAYIYIKSNDIIDIISKETFTNIINSIYYEYYLAWYVPFFTTEELNEYKKEKIDQCYAKLVEKLSKEIQFEVEYVNCPLLGDFKKEITHGYVPSKKKTNIKKYPLLILLILVGPLVLVVCYNYILNLLGIQLSTISSTIGSLFAAILSSVIALFLSNKR